MNRFATISLSLLGMLIVLPAQIRAQSSEFTILVQTGDVINGKTITNVGSPVMNDNGDVVFWAAFSGGHGLFAPSQLLVATGDVIDGKTLTGIFQSPLMNNNGDVVFSAEFSGGQGLFTLNQLLVATGDVIADRTLVSAFPPALNDNSELVFRGEYRLTGSSLTSGLFTLSQQLVGEGDTIGGIPLNSVASSFESPALTLNNNGDVVFRGFSFSGNTTGLFTLNQLLVATGDVIAGQTLTSLGTPAWNDNSELVFRGVYSGGHGLFTLNQLLVATGNVIDGKAITLISAKSPALNNNGEVVFRGLFAGGAGLFTPSSLIVATGNLIEGKVITDISGNTPALNNHGEIAFRGSFFDDGIIGAIVFAKHCGKLAVPTITSFSTLELANGQLGIDVDLDTSPDDAGPWSLTVQVETATGIVSDEVEYDVQPGTNSLAVPLSDVGIQPFENDEILTIHVTGLTADTGDSTPCGSTDSTTLAIPLPIVFIHGYIPPDKYTKGKTSMWRDAVKHLIPPIQSDPLFDYLIVQSAESFTTSEWRLPYERDSEEAVYPTLFLGDWRDLADQSPEIVSGGIQLKLDDALRSVYAQRVNLVTHSAGGLVARDVIRRESLIGIERVNKLIMVGCPNNGTSKTLLETSGFSLETIMDLNQTVAGFLIPELDGELFSLRGPFLKRDKCSQVGLPVRRTFIDVPVPPGVQLFNIFTSGEAGNTPWDVVAQENKAGWFRFCKRRLRLAQNCTVFDWKSLRRGDTWVAVEDAKLGLGDIEIQSETAHVFQMSDCQIRAELSKALGLVN